MESVGKNDLWLLLTLVGGVRECVCEELWIELEITYAMRIIGQ